MKFAINRAPDLHIKFNSIVPSVACGVVAPSPFTNVLVPVGAWPRFFAALSEMKFVCDPESSSARNVRTFPLIYITFILAVASSP